MAAHIPAPTLTPIGVLRTDIQVRSEAPKNYDESDRTGTIEIFPDYEEGLDGVVAGESIVVLLWFHEANRASLRVHPRGDTSRPLRGVFATRSPARPNPIAVSEYLVTAIEGRFLHVRGVDAIDGTPVLDLKSSKMQR